MVSKSQFLTGIGTVVIFQVHTVQTGNQTVQIDPYDGGLSLDICADRPI